MSIFNFISNIFKPTVDLVDTDQTDLHGSSNYFIVNQNNHINTL